MIEVETRSVDGEVTALGTASGGRGSVLVDLAPGEGKSGGSGNGRSDVGSGRGFSEGELLLLSVAGAVSNTLWREAKAGNRELTRVCVRVWGEVDGRPPGFASIRYDVDVSANMRPDDIRALVTRVNEAAQIPVLLRRAMPITLDRVTVRSDFPRRTLEDALAVCRFMERWEGPWWVVGGWAIDLWVGEVTREHEDIELCVPRQDQLGLRTLVADWRWYAPRDGKWAPFGEERMLESPSSMWQLRSPTVLRDDDLPPRWEFLLTDVDGGEWVFERDKTIRLPLERVIVRSPLGPPVASPEIVLLHKAFNNPLRAKDEHDFLWVKDRVEPKRRAWLREHLRRLLPQHRWLPQL
jgi:hypothetical protein